MAGLPKATLVGIILCAAASAASAAPDPALVSKCEACHGEAGEGPRLNGQPEAYLLQRFKAFADPTRNTPHATFQMWQTSTSVNDRTAEEIAHYFASQAPTPAAPGGTAAAEGERIYRQGAGPETPPCQQCHGAAGEGSGSVPRLAGQRAAYLESQMSAFMLGLRVSATMNKHAWRMSSDQFKAISAYLANDRPSQDGLRR
ncbi:MAG: c-type cytochrome [Alphaproteobacteria bacterium]|nr:c-type cytochrome [Alphaproteobacteria bacterium]